MNTRIYLMGYMGSGKSTLGKKIASAMDFQFIDLDKAIEENTHQTIAEIFNDFGEAHFRKLETKILKEVSKKEQVVIALGGGTPCFNENMEIIKSTGLSVYIEIPPKGLLNRLEHSKNIRPKIKEIKGQILLDYITKELTERELYYSQADLTVDGLNMNKNEFIANLKQFQKNKQPFL